MRGQTLPQLAATPRKPNLHSRNCCEMRQRLTAHLRRIGYTGTEAAMTRKLTLLLLFAFLAAVSAVSGKPPTGPITPPPGTPIQQTPPQPKIVTQGSLVNTPATVPHSLRQ